MFKLFKLSLLFQLVVSSVNLLSNDIENFREAGRFFGAVIVFEQTLKYNISKFLSIPALQIKFDEYHTKLKNSKKNLKNLEACVSEILSQINMSVDDTIKKYHLTELEAIAVFDDLSDTKKQFARGLDQIRKDISNGIIEFSDDEEFDSYFRKLTNHVLEI